MHSLSITVIVIDVALLLTLRVDAANIPKHYARCELIEDLQLKHDMPPLKAAIWTCLAISGHPAKTGNSNPLQRNDIRVRDIFECKASQVIKPCFLNCYELKRLDDNDYMDCMKKVHDSERNATGDGFNGWSAYESSCKGKAEEYLKGCSADSVESEPTEHPRPIEPSPTEMSAEAKHKIYEPCELAHELHSVYHVPLNEIGIWVCLAGRANYNASLVGPLAADGRNRDYGLWQIFSQWWCGQDDASGGICAIECSLLADNDIADDVKCVQVILRETMAKSGDGFTAWPLYATRCKANAAEYISECGFGTIPVRVIERPATTTTTTTTPMSETTHLPSGGKAFEVCELADVLYNDHSISVKDINTWICIMEQESNFSTASVSEPYSDGSRGHGILKISDNYWCSASDSSMPPACDLSCDKLHDAVLADDLACAQKIHERDGFSAWRSYNTKCRANTPDYIAQCNQNGGNRSSAITVADKPPKLKGKVFDLCELAVELRYMHRIPSSQINSWVCIAEHETHFNTSTVVEEEQGVKSFGLFHISDGIWCGEGKQCSIDCSDLQDSDITDDIRCAKKIFITEQSKSNNGFNAWTSYTRNKCRKKDASYTGRCFEGLDENGARI